jgi:hypothetical protein
MKKSKCYSIIFTVVFVLFSSPGAYSQGSSVSLQSYNQKEYFIGGLQGEMSLLKPDSEEEKELTTFKMVPGLANPEFVSIQSSLNPKAYLRHQNWILKLNERTDDGLFDADATFKKVRGLADPNDLSLASFEATNYPGNFIHNKDNKLTVAQLETSEIYKKSATFKITSPNWDGKNPKVSIAKSPAKPLDVKKMLNLILFVLLSLAGLGLVVFSICTRPRKSAS